MITAITGRQQLPLVAKSSYVVRPRMIYITLCAVLRVLLRAEVLPHPEVRGASARPRPFVMRSLHCGAAPRKMESVRCAAALRLRQKHIRSR
jgi:hypothetical protein